MQLYQIKLSPVEFFFFGSEKHISIAKDNPLLQTNYFVESNPYPQQTALLGLLRYYLLLKNPTVFFNKKIIQSPKAVELIGDKSFNFPNVLSFGKIASITPLYFLNKSEKYFFGPFDIDFELNKDYYLQKDGNPYKSKDYNKYIQQYLYSENQQTKLSLSDIISDMQQTGNEKGDKGKSKEDAYYKQVMKKFVRSVWSFAFDAAVEEGSGLQEETIYMPFGGEKCFFQVTIQKTNALTVAVYPEQMHNRDTFSLLCGSDCFAPWENMSICRFSVNRYVSFRNFQSTTSTQKIDSFTENINIGQVRSRRYNLLQRGSAMYFQSEIDRNKAKEIIEKQPGTAIGFNHLLINKHSQ